MYYRRFYINKTTLDDTLFVKHTRYERGIDYDTFFIATTLVNYQSPTIKKNLFLMITRYEREIDFDTFFIRGTLINDESPTI